MRLRSGFVAGTRPATVTLFRVGVRGGIMAARAYWQGQIRLALVSIPVQVFPATKIGGAGSPSTRSTSRAANASATRRSYRASAPSMPRTSSRATRSRRANMCFSTDEEIDDVKLEAKRTIDLTQFVDEDEIDPIYFDKPFYVAPEEGDETGAEAYVVLREALQRHQEDRARPARRPRTEQHRGGEALRQGALDRDAPLRRTRSRRPTSSSARSRR